MSTIHNPDLVIDESLTLVSLVSSLLTVFTCLPSHYLLSVGCGVFSFFTFFFSFHGFQRQQFFLGALSAWWVWMDRYRPSLLFPYLKGLFLLVAHFIKKTNSPQMFFSLFLGGRGSYSDIGGPVITTQVTIPKDVSQTRVLRQTTTENNFAPQSIFNRPVCLLCSWLAPSSVRAARGSSRSAMSPGHPSRLMNH